MELRATLKVTPTYKQQDSRA